MTAQGDVGQVTVMGLPPPTGVAVTVYGPPEPGAGVTVTVAAVGPVACTSTAGAPAAGVVMVSGGDAGVVPPPELVPVAVISYVAPGLSPATVQWEAAHVAVTGEPPPTGVAVSV